MIASCVVDKQDEVPTNTVAPLHCWCRTRENQRSERRGNEEEEGKERGNLAPKLVPVTVMFGELVREQSTDCSRSPATAVQPDTAEIDGKP